MKSNLQNSAKCRSFTFKSVFMTVIALVWAMGAQAQNNTFHPIRKSATPETHKRLNTGTANLKFLDVEQQKLPLLKAQKSGDWWEPDTVNVTGFDGNTSTLYIYSYNTSGLPLTEFSQYPDGRKTQKIYTYDNNDNRLTYLSQEWGNNNWENLRQETYTYDNKNNVLTKITEDWTSNIYNKDLDTYTYDSKNNRLTHLSQNWVNGDWLNKLLYTCTYDNNNNLLTELSQNWINNSWENEYQLLVTYTYDNNNNMLTRLVQERRNNGWENEEQYIYTYDNRNNLLTALSQDWGDNSWENDWQEIYTYNNNNNILTELYQSWDWEYESWVNGEQYTYTYDNNNNCLTYLYQEWYGDDWENGEQYTYTYDSNNNCLKYLYQEWYDEWIDVHEIIYTYDSNNNCILSEYFGEDEYNDIDFYYNNMHSWGGWYYGEKITISYKNVGIHSSISEIHNDAALRIYPNPVKDELRMESGELRIEKVEIFDVYGKKLLTFNSQLSTINVSVLAQGVYFVKVETDKGVVTKKFIKE